MLGGKWPGNTPPVTELWAGVREGEERATGALLSALRKIPLSEEIAVAAGNMLRAHRRSHGNLKVSMQGQLARRQALQDSERRFLWCDQRVFRDDKGLLERVLTGNHSMADHVGEDEPGRAGRKFPAGARGSALEFLMFFEEVMEAKHPLVVGRTGEAAHAEAAGELREHPVRHRKACRGRHSGASGERPGELVKRPAGQPHPRLAGVDVSEDPQNTVAI